jgi:hypothetical protein
MSKLTKLLYSLSPLHPTRKSFLTSSPRTLPAMGTLTTIHSTTQQVAAPEWTNTSRRKWIRRMKLVRKLRRPRQVKTMRLVQKKFSDIGSRSISSDIVSLELKTFCIVMLLFFKLNFLQMIHPMPRSRDSLRLQLRIRQIKIKTRYLNPEVVS